MWINKYKRGQPNYWKDTPQEHAYNIQLDIDRCIRQFQSYREIHNIETLGDVYQMCSFIYSGHKTKALEVWRSLHWDVRQQLPNFFDRYFA